MPGDTFTPPRQENSTVFDDGTRFDLHKGHENLIPYAQVQAERERREAHDLAAAAHEQERQLTPVEYAALQLAELHKARQDRMAA